jgi:hypothetical protein
MTKNLQEPRTTTFDRDELLVPPAVTIPNTSLID